MIKQQQQQQQQQREKQPVQPRRTHFFVVSIVILLLVSVSLFPSSAFLLKEHPFLALSEQQPSVHLKRSTTTTAAHQDSDSSVSSSSSSSSSSTTVPLVPTNNDTSSSSSSIIRPLRPGIDYERYTVRINTWKRQEQLRIALEHLRSCRASIAQIQVIWCLAQGPVPEWLLQFNEGNDDGLFVVVETHEENSLNERFHVLLEPPTYAILTTDDDLLRPCLALDAAFVKWTRNPHRMVGFDYRLHTIRNTTTNATIDSNDNTMEQLQIWSYSYQFLADKMNRYSLSLTRSMFTHVDYLYSYTTDMPAQIRQVVAEKLNCEDIAMSFWISKQASLYMSSSSSLYPSLSVLVPTSTIMTPQPPLLADMWAINSQVELAPGEKSIHAAASSHIQIRHKCVNDFANWLQLKGQLESTELKHETATANNNDKKSRLFEIGAPLDASVAEAANEHVVGSVTAQRVKERMDVWLNNDVKVMIHDLGQMSADVRHAAGALGSKQ
jgi:glucuronyl/N-acetylglucosaminyl transferase EXT2